MTIQELKDALAGNEKKSVELVLPDGAKVPAHFHVTEVGYVRKEFIDCGGTIRVEGKALLQIWVANDVDHRVDAGKLLQILGHGEPVLPTPALPVEIEYEYPVAAQFPLASVEVDGDVVSLRFESKHTDCLAKDVCGITESECCEAGSGCC